MDIGRRRAFASLALLALVLGACSSGAKSGEPKKNDSADVRIDGFLFKPASLSVRAGSTVEWLNTDDIAHTITSGVPGAPTGAFDSGDRTLDQRFSHEFLTPGTFAYFCRNHNSMRGEVVVT